MTVTCVKVAGIDVTAYLRTYQWQSTVGFSCASFGIQFLNTVSSIVTFSQGQTVEMWFNFGASYSDPADKWFSGQIESVNPSGPVIGLDCYDKLKRLMDSPKNGLTKLYVQSDGFGGNYQLILIDLFTTYGGLTADTSSVQVVPIALQQKVQFIDTNVFDATKSILQPLGWQMYYKASTDKVYAEPVGFPDSGVTLTVGSNIVGVPNWKDDRYEMVNNLVYKGASVLVQMPTETFSGTGSSATYTLTQTPVSIEVSVGGVVLTGGVAGVTGTYDYTYDPAAKQITGSFTAGSNNVLVKYTAYRPIKVASSDDESIASYGLKFNTVTATDSLTAADARARAAKIVANQKEPFIFATLKVRNLSAVIQAGNLVHVVDSINAIDRNVLITRAVLRYPTDYLELDVGDKEFRVVDETATQNARIKALEDKSAQNTDLVQNLVQLTLPQTFRNYSLLKTVKRINDSFIWGHTVNGLLGRGVILDELEGSNSARWTGTNCTVGDEAGTVRVGSGSMKLVCSNSPFYVVSTQSFGDLHTYTGANSGAPPTGTIGVWVYVSNPVHLSQVVLRIGSGSGNYTEVAGVKTFTNTFGLEYYWNYFVFRLKDGTTTGNPNWTSVAYARLLFGSLSYPTIYVDYFTIGTGDVIGLNGLGNRITTQATTTYTW